MDDLAARVRAARGYADLSQKELAERLGLEKQSVVRTEAGARDPKRAEQIAIAHVCGVPVDFMTGGFGQVRPDALAEVLERVITALRAVEPFPAPGGELGRIAGGSTPSDQGHRDEDSDQDTGAQPGSG